MLSHCAQRLGEVEQPEAGAGGERQGACQVGQDRASQATGVAPQQADPQAGPLGEPQGQDGAGRGVDVPRLCCVEVGVGGPATPSVPSLPMKMV